MTGWRRHKDLGDPSVDDDDDLFDVFRGAQRSDAVVHTRYEGNLVCHKGSVLVDRRCAQLNSRC